MKTQTAKIYGVYIPGEDAPHYIGQTLNRVEQRWAGHISALSKGSRLKVHCRMRKYGYEFKELVSVLNEKYINELECLLINQWKTFADDGGSNLTAGGNNGRRSAETRARNTEANYNRVYKPTSEETKNKLRQSLKGRSRVFSELHLNALKEAAAKRRGLPLPKSLEARANLSKALKGLKKSVEHCAKMSVAMKAKNIKLSAEHRQKLIDANTGRFLSEESRGQRSLSVKHTKRAMLLSKIIGISHEKLKADYTIKEITKMLAEHGALPKRAKNESF